MSKYIQTRFLGSGTYSEVYEAIDTHNNTKVALKKTKLSSTEGMPSTAIREIAIMRKLKHPNILTLIEVIHNPNLLTLVFEYIDYDLKKYLSVRRTNILPLIHQLLEGVAEIHQRKIVHRDLKPQNILVTSNGLLKIADFGLARSMEFKMPAYNSEVVTLWYRSPELLQGDEDYDVYIDMWSVGCIIFEMITNKPLFPGKDNLNQLQIIFEADNYGMVRFIYERTGIIPEILVELMLGCLCIDVKKRFKAQQCLYLLSL
ncbi:negative regulator of the PHO system [Conglomerata obtusa]